MKQFVLALLAGLLIGSAEPPQWSNAQVGQLLAWLRASPSDGLATRAADIADIERSRSSGDRAELDMLATRAAEGLLRDHIGGCCNEALRSNWHIENGFARAEIPAALAAALRADRLDSLFEKIRPSHPFYAALRAALAQEQDAQRRAILAANLDRWRWMPRNLGPRYLLVNAAAFEATLWEEGQMLGRWEIVVGKARSPTPVFSATVTGVIINPWWDIPPSIAGEGIAALVARNPAEAARRGYVREAGRYRQRPGPANALGRMKLVMPNGYNVYLHDSPAQALFREEVRTFSHGCVRVGDAIGLASALLGPPWRRERLDDLVSGEATRTIALPRAIPVYVAYFTAEPDETVGIRYFPDVYRRDKGANAPAPDGRCTR